MEKSFVARLESWRERRRKVMCRRIGTSARVISVQSRATIAAIEMSAESQKRAAKIQIYAVEDEYRCKPLYWLIQLCLSVVDLLTVAHHVFDFMCVCSRQLDHVYPSTCNANSLTAPSYRWLITRLLLSDHTCISAILPLQL